MASSQSAAARLIEGGGVADDVIELL